MLACMIFYNFMLKWQPSWNPLGMNLKREVRENGSSSDTLVIYCYPSYSTIESEKSQSLCH